MERGIQKWVSKFSWTKNSLISYSFNDNEVDFLVSWLPTQYGDNRVLRILNILDEEKELPELLKNSIH